MCLLVAMHLCSCRGILGLFSIYITCLILGFSDDTEDAVTVVFTISTSKKKSICADLVTITKVSNTFARQWVCAVPLLKI